MGGQWKSPAAAGRRWRRVGSIRLKCRCGAECELPTIAELLDAGRIRSRWIGSAPIADRLWLDDVVLRYPNRIIVAADTRERKL